MGIPVLVLGESGGGKSTSMRNFEQGEVFVFNVAGKPFPFRKQFNKMDNPSYQDIERELKKGGFKKYVIDDSQYLLAFEMFDKAKDTGYGKFTDMALHFRGLIDYVIRNVPNDVIVYFLHHTEIGENGRIKAKTVGKMLDNQLTVEGLFSIVLLAAVEGREYYFITQSDGYTTCKSPVDMFDIRISNDLKYVDSTIREYWQIPDSVPAEEMSITKNEWIRISKSAGNIAQIAENAIHEFGYNRAGEVKRKDLESICMKAEEMLKKYEEEQKDAEKDSHSDTGKTDGKAKGKNA